MALKENRFPFASFNLIVYLKTKIESTNEPQGHYQLLLYFAWPKIYRIYVKIGVSLVWLQETMIHCTQSYTNALFIRLKENNR